MAPSVKCESCGKTLVISDDVYQRRIQGRIVQVRCKGCNASIRVDGRVESDEETAELEPDDDESPPQQQTFPESAEVWAVDFDEAGHRELSTDQIRDALRDGAVGRHTLVWTVGLDTWVPISQVPALAQFLPATPAPSPVGLRPQQPTLAGFGDFPDASQEKGAKPVGQGGATRAARPAASGLGMRRGAAAAEVPSARTTLLGLNSAPAASPSADADEAVSLDGDVREVSEWESVAEEIDADALEEDLPDARPDLDSEDDSTKIYEGESSPYGAAAPHFPLAAEMATHSAPGQALPHAAGPFAMGPVPAAQPTMNGSNVMAPAGAGFASPAFAGNPFQPPPLPSRPNPALSNPFMSGPVAAAPAVASSGAPAPFQRSSGPIRGGAFAASAAQAELERLAELSVPEKSRTPLFVAIAAVGVVGLGLALVAMNAKPPAPTVTLPPPAQTSDVRRSSTALGTENATTSSTKDAAGDFAKSFKAGAGIAGAAVSAAVEPTTTFRSELALTALRQAEPKARACYRVGGPTRAEVVVRFQPSGRASQVRATGELAGTPTGMCLVSAFSDLEIASFQGGAQEFRGDVALQ